MKLRKCPFCGSKEVSVSFSIQNNEEKTKHYFIECHDCETMGPNSLLEGDACLKWNYRYGMEALQRTIANFNRQVKKYA